jgi:RNA polymerase sigma-70 factor (ECF subfamily)
MTEAVARAQAGDAGAFRELYEAHVGRVHALVLRLERDPSTVEELVQDVFVLAWRALSDFRGDAQVSTWLHRIAVNAVLEHRRRSARRERRVTLADDLDLLGASTPAPDAGLDMDLRAALETLPPGARAVFLLHEVEGYTHEEIAEMTGVTAGTCKTQLFRARRLLRKALDR